MKKIILALVVLCLLFGAAGFAVMAPETASAPSSSLAFDGPAPVKLLPDGPGIIIHPMVAWNS